MAVAKHGRSWSGTWIGYVRFRIKAGQQPDPPMQKQDSGRKERSGDKETLEGGSP